MLCVGTHLAMFWGIELTVQRYTSTVNGQATESGSLLTHLYCHDVRTDVVGLLVCPNTLACGMYFNNK